MTAARPLLTSLMVLTAMACGASTADAETFYVDQSSGSDTNACTTSAPCKTIGAAVKKSEAASGVATIEVAAGVYQETISLSKPADDGIAIVGSGSGAGGTEIEGPVTAGSSTVYLGLPGSTASLSNLSLLNPSGDTQDAIETNAQLTLTDVDVEMQEPTGKTGINIGSDGALTFDGGAVTMASSSEGAAIVNAHRVLTLNGVTITLENGAKGAGIEAQQAPVALSNVTVAMGATTTSPGITTSGAGISLNDVAVTMNGPSQPGIALVYAEAATAHGVSVSMADAASEAPGVEQVFGSAALDGLDVSGAWKGAAFEGQGSETTLQDSRLISGPAGEAPALQYIGQSENAGLLIQRSVLQAPAKAIPGAAEIVSGNATFDSSELLGGERGAYFAQAAGKTRTLTLASSTLDAGELGIRDAGALGVEALAENTASTADVNIEGSIVLEPSRANTGTGDTASVTCGYSDVPSQSQAAGAGNGSIACANGSGGNTETNPLSSLFAEPIGDYQLNPSSSAMDSVPAGTISLPFGFTSSATDVDGNPRVVDGNGDCMAVEDRGALELQGHDAACLPAKTGVAVKALQQLPTLGVLSALKLTPDVFLAAPSGATQSNSKRRYGTMIGYHDSQPGTTTLTVLRPTSGRIHGGSCVKPSHSNRKGRRCTLYVAVGSFTHLDSAGTASLHFSGRLKGKRLPSGAYRLQATPSDGAGKGRSVHAEFKIA
jgi:hypothetical protein